MRGLAFILLVAATGCRALLGIDDVELGGPVDGNPGGTDVLVAVDAPQDGFPMGACPASYGPVAGQSSLYRVTTAAFGWQQHRDTCAAEGGYLFIPDNATELGAVDGAVAQTPFWVGISDLTTEGTYRTSLNTIAVFLPWAPMQPTGLDDCVETSGGTFNDRRCTDALVAVCECDQANGSLAPPGGESNQASAAWARP